MEFLPLALTLYPQFIVYLLAPSTTRPGKTDKFPADYITGAVSNAHDPAMWTDANTAIAAAKRLGSNYGVGFVFTEADPFWFLDIDDCLEESGQAWSPTATTLLQAFAGAAVEVSQSGRGLHIIGSGAVPSHSCRNSDYKLEFYHSGRFVALTGIHAQGDASLDFTPQVKWLVDNFFPYSQEPQHFNAQWTNSPCPQWNGPIDDTELLRRALKSRSAKSAFGHGACFADLWEADELILAKVFPDYGRPLGYDESRADSALAQHLAFWTGNNCERIRGLMLQSKLKREKWDREDYLPRTILAVCGRQVEWLSDKQPEKIVTNPPVAVNSPRQTAAVGATMLSLEQQQELFAGCVHIAEDNKILIPGGYTYGRDSFNAIYGGFTMPLDLENAKITDEPWKAFIHSKALRPPKVQISVFRPDLAPGQIITKEDGQLAVNTHWPVNVPRARGDASLLTNHLKKLLPDERDAMILLCYMAAIVQYPGVKFQWCPLIQGVQGNGKTLLSRIVAYAVGDRYSHYPKAAEMSAKFNDWLYGKIFISVEDIYVSNGRLEFMDAIKPMITNDRQEIEPKGGNKVTRDICANFILNTNHKDGLRIAADDRRFAPFFTAQQSVEDLARDGMDWGYFDTLFKWLKNGGLAICAELLHTLEIPDEFNPSIGSTRAPTTTSTQMAVAESMGTVEQEIIEQVESGRRGFKGGWISSIPFNELLNEKLAHHGRRLSHKKREEMLKILGYVKHPGLPDGRVNNPLPEEGGKPKLYILKDHPEALIMGAVAIVKAYTDAQKG